MMKNLRTRSKQKVQPDTIRMEAMNRKSRAMHKNIIRIMAIVEALTIQQTIIAI